MHLGANPIIAKRFATRANFACADMPPDNDHATAALIVYVITVIS